MLLPPASAAGNGSAIFWPPILATWGPGGQSELHAHHAWQIIVPMNGMLRARASLRARWRDAAAILVAPDAPHAVDARGGDVLIVFVEPRSDVGRRLRGTGITAVEVPRPPGSLDRSTVAASLPGLLEALGASTAAGRAHPAIARVLRHLAQLAPGEGGDTSLAALAQVAGLSPGRFMHAFTETVGVPLRPYLLWQRLGHAAAAIAAGEPLSAAAAKAGFADAAHLTRTFRRMFGTSPSEARRRSQIVQEAPR